MDSKKEVNIDGCCLNNIRCYDNLRPESETSSINSVPDEHQDDIILELKNLRVKYSNKIIMGHLNIDSIRNKFELLSLIDGDRNDKGGEIMLFVKDGIITFPLDRYSFPVGFEAFCIELNLRKKKWLIFCIYNPHNRFIKHRPKELGKAIEFYSKTYENIIIMGDFNAEISESNLASFCTFYNFKSLINEPNLL